MSEEPQPDEPAEDLTVSEPRNRKSKRSSYTYLDAAKKQKNTPVKLPAFGERQRKQERIGKIIIAVIFIITIVSPFVIAALKRSTIEHISFKKALTLTFTEAGSVFKSGTKHHRRNNRP